MFKYIVVLIVVVCVFVFGVVVVYVVDKLLKLIGVMVGLFGNLYFVMIVKGVEVCVK